METFTVGQLANIAEVNVETVRYYERRGLLPEPARSQSRYRQYTMNDVARISFINRAKELGFTLEEIAELLALRIDSEAACEDVKKLATQKVTDIQERIRDLQKIKKKLQRLVKLCDQERTTTNDCPILEALDINKPIAN